MKIQGGSFSYSFLLCNRCDTCEPGTYSLGDPYDNATVCKLCDTTKATCLGGAKIAPKPGYWRYSLDTDIILECPGGEKACGYELK